MSHLVRSAAVAGALVLAVAVPSGVAAKAKPKHTTTVITVNQLPSKLPKNISRKCGSSKSASKIRARRVSRPTKNRVRVITTYCDGGTRTTFTIKRSVRTVIKTVTVPAPAPAAPPVTPAATASPTPTATATPTATPSATPTPREFRLTLLHNNDGESKYVVGDSIANYGGITRFKTVLDRARAEAATDTVPAGVDKGTVTISSGDNFLAGLNLRASFQRFDTGAGPFYDSDAIAALGYDAVTIGNHEYDFGPTRLAEFIANEGSGVPFLSANTDFSAEPDLQSLRDDGRIADSVVVKKGNQLIGIIGVSPPETPTISAPRNVKFASDVAGIVNEEAERLTDAGVNKIILSSHLQDTANERAVVAKLKDVDIVISGGADDLLANPGALLVPVPNSPGPVGPYPLIISDSTGKAIPLVTTQGEYRYLGRLTVTFDEDGVIESTDTTKSGPIRITADPAQPDYATEDATLKARITDPLVAYKANLAANKIGTTEVLLDGGNPNPIRQKESNLGDLVADAFLTGVNRTAAADGRPVAKVAFSNGGGIRNTIAAGDITEKSTFDVLPFDNVLVTVPNVSPERFKELMEWGVAALPGANGRFPQIAGYKMTVDTTKTAQVQDAQFNVTTPGQRITSLTLDDGTKIVENGAIVAGAPSVNLATTNFTAANGDSYPFRDLKGVAAGVPYQQSLYDYIVNELAGKVTAAQYPVGGAGRIVITP
jgi:5'-nucleotidase